MKLINALVLIVGTVFSALFSLTVSAESEKELPFYSKYYDDKRDPFADATHAIKLAAETNRNVLIEIGGNWCSWCKKMDAFLAANPKVYQDLHSKYVLLKVNVSDSNENAAFMQGLPPVLGYPHMYVSTSTGKMLLSKDTAELLENGEYSIPRWQTFIDKWQVSPQPVKSFSAISE